MKNIRKHSAVLAALAFACAMCLYLQSHQAFAFYYREQHQLFLIDPDILIPQLFSVGGLSRIMAQGLMQFFAIPLMGPLITALCGAFTSLLLWAAFRRITPSVALLPLCFAPAMLDMAALADTNYFFGSYMGLLLAALFISLTAWSFKVGRLVGCVTGAVLLALWFPLCYMPNQYYEPLIQAPQFCLYAKIAIPFCAAAFLAGRYAPHTSKTARGLGGLLCAILVVGGFLHAAGKRANPGSYRFLELEHYVLHEEWDKVIEAFNSQPSGSNSLYLNCLNLALAHKGELTEKLLHYPQDGMKSLISSHQNLPDVMELQSLIFLQMGDVAAAQNAAFNANVCYRWGAPSTLKTLVLTNLVYGQYEVAEKYIAQLERTWRYAGWATRQRRFLHREEAILADPLLSRLKKSLTSKDHFAVATGYIPDLELIVEANPDNEAAWQYLISMALLEKDSGSIRRLAERYVGTSALPQAPEILQEAILSIEENNPDYLRKHGVDEDTFKRYAGFSGKYAQSRNSGRNPAMDLLPEYGRTFWYYLIFKK